MHIVELETDLLDQVMYRGEGNSSIVIALKTHAKVIRLFKRDTQLLARSRQDASVDQNPSGILNFIRLIMKPLTEPFLSDTPQLIHLRSEFIRKLSMRIETYRPLHRLDKTLLLDDQYALIMDDLCTLPNCLVTQIQPDDLCGPTISIEIKPKQGFLPTHRLLMRSSTNDQPGIKMMRDCCVYGSHQHLKQVKGRIERRSDYCPIDLFSGCPVRMKLAINELIRNPQNNFRAFKDRALAYDDNQKSKLSNIFENFFEPERGDMIINNTFKANLKLQTGHEDRLVDLLIQCLLNDNENKNSDPIISGLENENLYLNSDICLLHPMKVKCRRCYLYTSSKKHKFDSTNQCHRLPRTCVLSNVLRAQKLDSIGAYEALSMLEWLLEHFKTDPNVDVIGELSKPQVPDGFGSSHQLPFEDKEKYYFRKVWEFLVSLTAKDCSIMVTLRRVSPNRYESIVSKRPNLKNHLLKDHVSGSYYLFNVGIADLDQKLPFKIPKICDNLNTILHGTDNLSKRLSSSPHNKA